MYLLEIIEWSRLELGGETGKSTKVIGEKNNSTERRKE